MSTTHPGYNFLKRVGELQAKKKEIDGDIERECERLMRKCRVPEVGTVYHDIQTGVTIKILDRSMDLRPNSTNWSMNTFGVMLNGNPVDKRGKLDTSTRTGIYFKFQTP
jgi:hypothetical protein